VRSADFFFCSIAFSHQNELSQHFHALYCTCTGCTVCGIVQGYEVTKEYSIGMAGDMGIKGCHSFAAFCTIV